MRTKANDQNEKEKLVVQRWSTEGVKVGGLNFQSMSVMADRGDGKGKWGWNNGRK